MGRSLGNKLKKDSEMAGWQMDILQKAIKRLPSMRFALGIAGLIAVVAIGVGSRIGYQPLIFGTFIVLALMFVLLGFTKLAAEKDSRALFYPAFILSCILMALFATAITFLLTSYFFSWPRSFQQPEITASSESIAQKRVIMNYGIPEISPDDLPCGSAWVYLGAHYRGPLGRWTGPITFRQAANKLGFTIPDPGSLIITTWDSPLYIDGFQDGDAAHRCDHVKYVPFQSIPPQVNRAFAGTWLANSAARIQETRFVPDDQTNPGYVWVRIAADPRSEP